MASEVIANRGSTVFCLRMSETEMVRTRGGKERKIQYIEKIEMSGHRKIGRPKLLSDVIRTWIKQGEMGTERRSTRSENMEYENLMMPQPQIGKRPKRKI